jgi:cytochrome oxidase assembly protein ShyY1
VYRFLLTPRWIALALVMTLAAATMVGLGLWQLSRYHLRSEINARIDAAAQAPPQPLAQVLQAPADSGVGPAPSQEDSWSVVAATGRYDVAHEIVARARTFDGTAGFEIITPLVLADGTAILVDRGFLAATSGVATEIPAVPAAPNGEVVVVGRVHAPESRATAPELLGDRLVVRRIDPFKIAEAVPYPLYGGYLTLASQTPPATAELTPLPPDRQNPALNAGYTVQWWAFAALTLFGFGYLAYRQAHPAQRRPAAVDQEGHPISG